MKSVRRYKIRLFVAMLVAFGGLAAVITTNTHPKLGLDLEGGISVILTAEAQGGAEIDQGVLQQTVEIIRQRIDAFGVAEPEVSVAGTNNILIQLPGVENEERALQLIGSTAQLTFRQVEEVIPPTAKDAPEITTDNGPDVNDKEVVYPSANADEAGVLYRLKPARLTGEIVDDAEAVTDQLGNQWRVSIKMSGDGARTWATFTGELACLRDEGDAVKSQVAIVLDGRVESAAGMNPNVQCDVGISGGGTEITVGDQEEAKQLALVLRTGALPLTLEQSEVQKVSPTLGRDSLDAGLKAGLLGLGLVMIYMLLYYRGLGLVVWVGLCVFSALLYTIMCLLGQSAGLSLSLAGIAGVIVSVGITADSYIVAFERLKDEIRSGKSMRAAVDRGMARAFKTILVADFVTGAAAVILFMLAVGPVRGFALTLGLATLIDVLVAYYFTRSAVTLLARTKFFSEGRFVGLKEALGVEA
ncbi:MAG: preprotein translocase subunit SecD [Actinomycetota bacterium]|nr:preprotein translocase subunit SecD [Actinomycetota bacterium]